MRGCEVIWNAEDAARVQELVRAVAGGTCPCYQGVSCPLIPPEAIASLRQEMSRRRQFTRAGNPRNFVALEGGA